MLHYYICFAVPFIYTYLSIYVVEFIKTFRGTAVNNQ